MSYQKAFAKLAIFGGVGFLLTVGYQIAFIVLPSYDLVSESSFSLEKNSTEQHEALVKLEQLQATAEIVRIVQIIFLLLLVGSLTVVAISLLRSHAKQVSQ